MNTDKTTDEANLTVNKEPRRFLTSHSLVRKIILVIISVILGINVYLWNANHLLGNELPMPFGFGVSVVMSGSMEPALSVNDMLVISESNTYDKDDIVVFQDGGVLVVHRITSVNGDTVVTKGDANEVADNPISVSEIKGKVSFTLPFVGAVVRVIKTPIGVIVMLIIALLLMELSYKKENKKNNKEEDETVDEIKRQIAELRAEKANREAIDKPNSGDA